MRNVEHYNLCLFANIVRLCLLLAELHAVAVMSHLSVYGSNKMAASTQTHEGVLSIGLPKVRFNNIMLNKCLN